MAGWQPEGDGGNFVEYIVDFSSDGNQHLGMAEGHETWQDLGIGLEANTVYTLTVNAGNRDDNFTPPGQASTFGLYVGGAAGGGGTLLADGTFDAEANVADAAFSDDLSITYTTGGTVDSGNLFISLRSTGAGRAHYDNVRLDATLIPEPSGLGLSLLAGLGLLGIRCRR